MKITIRAAIGAAGLAALASAGSARAHHSVPKVGDSLEVCAFPPPLDDSVARRRLELRIVAGHVLVTPGGAMQAWGHGYIAGCMRSPKDQRQPWLDS